MYSEITILVLLTFVVFLKARILMTITSHDLKKNIKKHVDLMLCQRRTTLTQH